MKQNKEKGTVTFEEDAAAGVLFKIEKFPVEDPRPAGLRWVEKETGELVLQACYYSDDATFTWRDIETVKEGDLK